MTTLAWKVARSRTERKLDLVIRTSLLLILVLAPLPFGSVEPWAYSALEVSIAAVAFLWLYRLYLFPSTTIILSPLYTPAILFLVLMGLQLVPMPREVLQLLSPRTVAFYDKAVVGYAPQTRVIAATEAVLAGEKPLASSIYLPISQVPHATRTYLLKGIAFTLFLFLVLNSFVAPAQVRSLLYALVFSGAFQAFYGLIEYLSGHQHIFAYHKKYYTDAATGTFINRNHFAGFLEMTLLVALGLLSSEIGKLKVVQTWRERLLALTEKQTSLTLTLLLSLGVIVIALVLSYSRAGIILGLSMAGIFTIMQLRKRWSLKKTILVSLLAVIVLTPAYGVGYWTLTGRYALLTQELTNRGGRLTVWQNTLRMSKDFAILGSGAGTFQYVFPRYRDAVVTDFYDFAHNDYLQIFAEMGAGGVLLLVWGMCLVIRLWKRKTKQDTPFGPIRSAIGYGLLAVALHETVDFGLQIPSILLTLVILVACLSWADSREVREQFESEIDYA